MSENRLIFEKSPYLLQHAKNPVDWYIWSEEALNKAKEEDKPIFLSIGYSTCHWCHNMARESFENKEIAGILNKYFVPIKVDREERYDLDNLYMKFCQATSGRGGWPLSVFMTPDGLPFFAGTYFPRINIKGMIGFKTVLLSLKKMWEEDREEIEEKSVEIRDFVLDTYEKYEPEDITKEDIENSVNSFKSAFDPEFGGFGEKPKFPMAHSISYLLEYYEKYGDEELKDIALHTLDSMFKGGIYDHVGGGFSRYSVDEKWMVPHFEKMLYDNALLIEAYSKAYKISGNEIYKKVVEDTILFLIREMEDESGAFYAGIDADSEGDEGKFYLYTKSELGFVLGKDIFERFTGFFNASEMSSLKGRVVLNRVDKEIDIDDYKFLDRWLKVLFKYRENRIKPSVDNKIMTTWNSLLAKSLYIAGEIFENRGYIRLAENILRYIEENLIVNGRIMTASIDGVVKYKGYIQDYSCYIDALLEGRNYYIRNHSGECAESRKSVEFTDKINEYTEKMIDLFMDAEKGGFYINGVDSDDLVIRCKETNDGSVPAGNSVAARVLVKIGRENSDERLVEVGKKAIDLDGTSVNKVPIYHSEVLRAGLLYHNDK